MNEQIHSIKLLIIEDNEGDFVLVEEFVVEQFDKPELTHVKTFQDAKEILKEKNAEYDVILLDLSLPDHDGDELIDDMLAISGNIPIVILTGYTDLSFSMTSLAKGISDYLLKDDLSPALLYKSLIYSIERNVFSRKIKESEKNYRDLFELSPQPMWLYDVDTLEFLDVNNAAVKHYGYSKDEFLQMTIRDIRPKEDIADLDKAVAVSKKRSKITNTGVFRHQKKTGEIINVEIKSSKTNYKGRDARIILAVDITEKLKEEERLKLLESVITNTTEAVAILEALPKEGEGHNIVYVNEAFTEITGYKPEEVIGRTFQILNGPKTDTEQLQKLEFAMNNWEICEVEMISYKKNGSEFWINTSIVPVADKEGGYSHWVAIARDITKRKQNEEDLKESMQEKDVLLAEIHHRVKNNLAVVSGMMQLQAFGEKNKEVELKLNDSIFRISTMATIHELLYQSGSFSKLEFSKIIEELIISIDTVLNSQKEITKQINKKPIQLNINQAIPCALIINEVITNIYKHAFKNRKKGTITVTLSEEDKKIKLMIEDDGIGLSNNFKNKTSNSLGMQIIEILTAQLNATHEFKSTNEGTIFALSFIKTNQSGIGSANVD